VTTASGDIDGTGVARVREARSLSGGINLAGDFAGDAQIVSVSGDVTLRFTPPASLRIDADSLNGVVNANGLALNPRQTGAHSLAGTLAAGANSVSVRTTSGDIRLLRGS
jgi:hypothetical protein